MLQDILQLKSALTSKPTNLYEEDATSDPSTSTTKARATSSNFYFQDIKLNVPLRETTETKEKQQDLLRQQYCNFRAFERAVEKTSQEIIMEKLELEDGLKILKNKWEKI